MSRFLLVFLTLYGGMNFYFFRRLSAAVHPSRPAAAAAAFFLLLMIAAPAAVRILEKRGVEWGAIAAAWVGYLWMGGLFIFVCAAAAIDAWRGFCFLLRLLPVDGLLLPVPSPLLCFAAPAAAALVVLAAGAHEASAIRTEKVQIRSPKIPPGGRVRIAQISDVHVGLIVREKRIGRIIDAVREAAPDILVSTGDLVDGQVGGLVGLIEMFRGVQAPLGKFAVTGNHEYYVGLGQSLAFTEKAGFTLLRSTAAAAGDAVLVAGVDDSAVPGTGGGSASSLPPEELFLRDLDRSRFVVLLKHRPVTRSVDAGLVDLQLSGHVHGGQIFPFGLITRFFFPARTGVTRLPNGSTLYVSRGSGTWGPPVRFLAPPEVTVIDILPPEPS